jgi:hypothetical protein
MQRSSRAHKEKWLHVTPRAFFITMAVWLVYLELLGNVSFQWLGSHALNSLAQMVAYVGGGLAIYFIATYFMQ